MRIAMKRIILFAAVAALVSFLSCSRMEEADNNVVKINISVSAPAQATKAVKTGWEIGDIINVYLNSTTTGYTPDFTLTYDGSKWIASEISSALEARFLATGGTLRGFWEGSNSCMSNDAWSKSGRIISFPGRGDDEATTGTAAQLVAGFYDIPYTYDGSTLTATINTWRIDTHLQITVAGIDYEAGRYTMYSDQLVNFAYIRTQNGATEFSDGRIAGIENADGVAFVCDAGVDLTAGKKLTLYLLDNTTGVKYEFSKTLSSSLAEDNTKVTAIKIPIAKFVVDMGLKVKWAAGNLGASRIFPAEDNYIARRATTGDYYAWGATEPYYDEGYAYESYHKHWKPGKEDGYAWTSYVWDTAGDGTKFTKYTGNADTFATSGTADGKNTLEPEDDAATVALGAPYRIPTYEEWDELKNSDNCRWERDLTNYLYKVYSLKPGYTNQYIILPAAGRWMSISYYRGDSSFQGYYWSATCGSAGPNNAWNLEITTTTWIRDTRPRFQGLPIRPVSD